MSPMKRRIGLLKLVAGGIIWKAVHQVGAFQAAMPIALPQLHPYPLKPHRSSLRAEKINSSRQGNKSHKNQGSRGKKPREGAHSKHQVHHWQVNKQIVQCNDARELLGLLQTKPLGQTGSGGALSSVNFSTALHRLARHSLSHSQRENGGGRTEILSDVRFALFLASLAETIAAQKGDSAIGAESKKPLSFTFDSRELANIGWAIGKLQFAPPLTAMPVCVNLDSCLEAIAADARNVRNQVMEAARQKRDREAPVPPAWIPALSRLAGYVLDYIGLYIVETEQEAISAQYRDLRPFQLQEYANLLYSFSTSGRAVPVVCCLILRRMMERQRSLLRSLEGESKEAMTTVLQPQEWSNAIWSMATFPLDAAADTIADSLEFLSMLLNEYAGFASQFKPQEWSNTVWAVATLLSHHQKIREDGLTEREEAAARSIFRVALRTILGNDGKVMLTMKSQELVNTIWSLATLGFGLLSSSAQTNANNYIVLRDQQPEDKELKDVSIVSFVNRALEILPSFRSQELNNMVWALARLVEDDISETSIPKLLEQIARELSNPRRNVKSQDIGTSLWGLASLGISDPELYRGVCARVSPKMVDEAKPQELSNIVWAIATAEVPLKDLDAFDTTMLPASKRPTITDPLTKLFGLVAQELMNRTQQFKPQEIKDILWSFSKERVRFPTLFKYIAEYLVGGVEAEARFVEGRGFDGFSSQTLGNVAWAYARQAQLSEDVLARNAASVVSAGNGRLVVYTTAYLDFGESLLKKLFALLAEAYMYYYDNLKRLNAQDICVTTWAFAVLGLKHSKFVTTARDEVQRRLQDVRSGDRHVLNCFKGQELANLCWAMGTLNIETENFVSTLTDYVTHVLLKADHKQSLENIARAFSRQELANLGWSCAVFWKFPEPLMSVVYQGLVGLGREQIPSELIRAHGDEGMQPQSIMTLIYVHTAMGLVGSCRSLSLPPDFPTGWQESSPSESFGHTTDSMLELRLSTSKLQKAVSKSLNRIGFDHVVEHVITMHDLVGEHGITVSDSPLEVLSIDMADVEKKIAIEVDGPAHFVTEIGAGQSWDDDDAGYAVVINGKKEWQFQWSGARQSMNGSTVLKHRLLSNMGWRVINIPFWDWFLLDSDEAAEDDYCRRIISSVSQ